MKCCWTESDPPIDKVDFEWRTPQKVEIFESREQMNFFGDDVNHPPHYTNGKVETIDIIEQVIKDYPSVLGWSLGQVIKYICRAPFKGKLKQDLLKAQWYLNRAISQLDNQDTGL